MVRWDDPGHVIFNTLAAMVFVAAAVWLVSPAAKDVRHGWKSKLVWLLALSAGGWIGGFYLPVGPIAVLWHARRVAPETSKGHRPVSPDLDARKLGAKK